MARISTYTQDTTPHPGDHVIGTNAGSADESHRSETVTFSLDSLGSFILNTRVSDAAGETTVNIGGDTTTVPEPAGMVTTPGTFRYSLNYAEGTAAFELPPIFNIRHGLGTSNVHIQIFTDIVDRDNNGNDLGTTTRVILPPQGGEVDWFATIDDDNTVTIRFAFQVPLVGFITISG